MKPIVMIVAIVLGVSFGTYSRSAGLLQRQESSSLRLSGLDAVSSAAGGAAARATSSTKEKRSSDAQIRKHMIAESIAAYAGNCPCPYNTASNGSSCGKRSAWSRPGGESPLCYPSDISAEMVQEYRDAHSDS
jgi:hypothetical protein